jgi:hypothetical protein
LADQLLAKQSPEGLRSVAAPKLAGSLNLGGIARVAPMASFVAFSSIAALLGNAAQANYSAANAAMDAWASTRSDEVPFLLHSAHPSTSSGW